MKCKFCGMEVDEKQRFCPNCGLLLDLSFTAYSVHSIQKAEGKEEKTFQEYSDKGTVNEDEAKSFVQETVREPEIEESETEEKDNEAEITEPETEESSEGEVEIEEPETVEINNEETETEESETVESETEEFETGEKEIKAKDAEEGSVNSREGALQKSLNEMEEDDTAEEVIEEDATEAVDEEDDAAEAVDEEDDAVVEADKREEEKVTATASEGLDAAEADTSAEVIHLKEYIPEANTVYSNKETEEPDEEIEDSGEEIEDSGEEIEDSEEEIEDSEEEIEDSEEEIEDSEEEIEDKEDAEEEIKDTEEEFFGEIPDDPDDFHEKAMVPPESLKELKAKKPGKKIIIATVAAAVLGISGINYLNSSSVRYDSLLKKGDNLIKADQYDEAVQSLEKEKGSFKLDERYYLLLSNALSKAGRHDDAVSCLEEAVKNFPNSETVKSALTELNPKVSSNISEETYHDSITVELKSDYGKIIYSLTGGKEDVAQAEYTSPIPISRNGKYTILAYALSSDGAKGELYTKEFTVDLDKEKYHLSSFVDSEEGKIYIDANGDKAVGWTLIDGSYYYFNEKGIMQSGFLDLDGERYYLDSDGKMHTGRLDLGDKSYYFDENGHMIRDAWMENRYYLDENGEMLKNQKNSEGIYFDKNGDRSFDAESLYKEHPDSILSIVSKERKTEGNHYIFTAKVYYQKKNGRPVGDPAYETEIIISKSALMSYLDETLPSITAQDAVSFLPKLYLQNIVQNKEGIVTKFSFVLGERHH